MSNQQGSGPSAQSRGQAAGWQDDQGRQRARDPRASQGYGSGRNMPATRGSYEPSYYGGGAGGGPFAMMRRISDEMDRIFESFGMGGPLSREFGPGGMERLGGDDLRTLWSPHIEVCEREGKLLIQADLPGIRKEDVNVQVEQDAVILQGERKHETERDEQGFYHSERSYGSFYRVIPLPEGVDTEQAKATFRDGVLEIELPAPQQRQRGRRLTIEDRQGEAGARGQPGSSQAGGTSPSSGRPSP